MQVPYHRYLIGEEEKREVIATLESGWLTSGPRVKAFEEKFSRLKAGTPCIGISSCTAGLFVALKTLDLKPGDEVITTPMTFVSSSNVIYHCGAKPVFADVLPGTLNLDPDQVAAKLSPQTKAILPVHVGGAPCDMTALGELASLHNLALIEDCAHAIEGTWEGKPLGTIGMAGAFSFYPTKNITTGEGGILSCQNEELENKCRLLVRHGLTSGTWERTGSLEYPRYDVVLPGYKYNLTDYQAALGLIQLLRLEEMYQKRAAIQQQYDEAFKNLETVQLIEQDPRGKSALHLYRLLLKPETLTCTRDTFIREAKTKGVQLSLNYLPVHLFTWYRNTYNYQSGDYPVAETAGNTVISLPFFPDLRQEEIDYVIEILTELLSVYTR